MKTKNFATETQAATNERVNEHNNDRKNVEKSDRTIDVDGEEKEKLRKDRKKRNPKM